MSGNLLHGGTAISCPHGGRAVSTAAVGGAQVQVDGVPVVTAADQFMVSGCPHTVGGRPQPCTSIRWTAAARSDDVTIDGVPVLLDTSAAMCFSAGLVPQGPPVVAPVHQGVSSR